MELAAVGCEQVGGGVLGQLANTLTSLAFVAAGLAILAGRSRGPGSRSADRLAYGLLVVAVGAGSVVQHGPHPDWQAYAHDLPLGALLGFVAADAASDLAGRRLSPAWGLVPSAALVPAVILGPLASTVVQAVLAAGAVGLNLWRARRRPALRRTLLMALAALAVGALAGTVGEGTGLCQPASVLQGHAVWHVLAALALWLLAPAIGTRGPAVGRLATVGSTTPVRG